MEYRKKKSHIPIRPIFDISTKMLLVSYSIHSIKPNNNMGSKNMQSYNYLSLIFTLTSGQLQKALRKKKQKNIHITICWHMVEKLSPGSKICVTKEAKEGQKLLSQIGQFQVRKEVTVQGDYYLLLDDTKSFLLFRFVSKKTKKKHKKEITTKWAIHVS